MRVHIAMLTLVVSTASQSVLANESALPETMEIGGQELPLLASATREEMWIDVYHCGIYTKSAEVTTDISKVGAVAVDFKVTTDLLPDEPPELWKQALRPALSKTAYNSLKVGFANLNENEHLRFSFVPDQGTSVELDDEKLFTTAGDDLIRAILALLVGARPASDALKDALLSNS